MVVFDDKMELEDDFQCTTNSKTSLPLNEPKLNAFNQKRYKSSLTPFPFAVIEKDTSPTNCFPSVSPAPVFKSYHHSLNYWNNKAFPQWWEYSSPVHQTNSNRLWSFSPTLLIRHSLQPKIYSDNHHINCTFKFGYRLSSKLQRSEKTMNLFDISTQTDFEHEIILMNDFNCQTSSAALISQESQTTPFFGVTAECQTVTNNYPASTQTDEICVCDRECQSSVEVDSTSCQTEQLEPFDSEYPSIELEFRNEFSGETGSDYSCEFWEATEADDDEENWFSSSDEDTITDPTHDHCFKGVSNREIHSCLTSDAVNCHSAKETDEGNSSESNSKYSEDSVTSLIGKLNEHLKEKEDGVNKLRSEVQSLHDTIFTN